jgi:integrase
MPGAVHAPAILDWLGDAVLSSDRTEQAARATTIKKVQARYDQIEARVGTMYMDKLDERITQEFFDNQAATLRREQDGLLGKIQSIQKAALAPVDDAIDMLRLTSRASELFLQQPGSEQRRLLQTVVEKAAWKDGALQPALFEPFEILRHSNQKSYRKEKENGGSGRDLCAAAPAKGAETRCFPRPGKAYSAEQKASMLAAAKRARSRAIYPALMLALNTGERDSEIRNLQWERMDLAKAVLTVSDSKTEAGEGRTIPLYSALLDAMIEYAKWYTKRFGTIQPNWYVFPFGKPRPNDPTRPMITLKTSWDNVRKNAGVSGRWHDNRHTLITDLAESGAGDETIRAIAGHVSPRMLKHYSHIRMEAKRKALAAIVPKPLIK